MITSQEFEHLTSLYPVLGALTSRQRETFKENAVRMKHKAANAVFHAGNPCTSFSFISTGILRVMVDDGASRDLVVYRLGPGDACVLAASSLLGGYVHYLRGIAESEVVTYNIPSSIFMDLVKNSDSFRSYLFSLLGDRVRFFINAMQEMTFHRLDQRLAGILLNGREILKVTHLQLAEELGTVREVVTRILNRFEKGRLIKVGRGNIRVMDVAGLTRIARQHQP